MKAVLTCLLLLLTSSLTFGIGRPHNLFAARKALLQQRTAQPASSSLLRQVQRSVQVRIYSYTFSPRFSQTPHIRE